ncbi:alpha-1,6-mannosyl-glycoprotein 2-beta-N-acetylglucosaminyltransferase isoform X2 [Neocloeon triangulifer]|uniref:alpha-1,6-mannosyl-glycoprotein 2-beta-N-acetylglucosaminyltransferase isoform X2 n=1 Tax=Neocloeon triangulifer TaxID=2078957 RepID=UPI00286F7407|nr:alpha-1,6-mannosyl-glycoprotein 2-beta-N-acetylglucosaminyltransferase isoform X2 [Neocloeon triangulifer]
MRGNRGSRTTPPLLAEEGLVGQLHQMLPPSRGARSRRSASCIRTAVFIFIVTFLWLQLHMANLSSSTSGSTKPGVVSTPEAENTLQQFLNVLPVHLHKFLLGRNSTQNGTDVAPPHFNTSMIKQAIEQYNRYQVVLNEDTFGPLHNDSLVIVVQVHTRITYLRHLIVSLAQAKGIENVLLVISHDFFDPEINELVHSIDFCKVMQIFYPYSIQTHPKEFPGESLSDCPRNIKKEQAQKIKCINADHPDLYGHYREAKFTQTKHHWWWKANRVFDHLEVTKNHTGLVLFLEEDHYVAEDFIEALRLMKKATAIHCDKCNILSLGTYLKTYNYYGDSKNAEVTPWVSSKHNMGMAFNRTTWREIRKCAKYFCDFDDYNWDWSLQQVSQNCISHKLFALVMRGPRVFHVGECGVHHKKTNCESTAAISKVLKVLKNAKKHLFPSHLTLTIPANLKKQKPLRKGNGGWGDKRDHQLCYNMTVKDFVLN